LFYLFHFEENSTKENAKYILVAKLFENCETNINVYNMCLFETSSLCNILMWSFKIGLTLVVILNCDKYIILLKCNFITTQFFSHFNLLLQYTILTKELKIYDSKYSSKTSKLYNKKNNIQSTDAFSRFLGEIIFC